MGPGRDLEDNASARIRNIETFEVAFRVFTIIVISTIILIKIILRKVFASSWRATSTCASIIIVIIVVIKINDDHHHFQETLRKFLASNEYLRYNKLVTFHPYNNEDESEVLMIILIDVICLIIFIVFIIATFHPSVQQRG